MYNYLKNNKPEHLTGLSSTPYTDDEEQNKKIDILFNKPFISECSYKKAIENTWINDCKYHIYMYDKSDENKDQIIDIIQLTIDDRLLNNNWKTKKL